MLGESLPKIGNLIFWVRIPSPPALIEVKFCTAKRTPVPVGSANFDVNRCNQSLLRGEKPDFWPVSKFNCRLAHLAGKKKNHHHKHLQPARIVRSTSNFAW